MKALIKKGTILNPVYATVVFEPNGWRFVGDVDIPKIWSDRMDMEHFLSFAKNAPFLEDYELIDVEVKPILKDETEI
jgi:hypothetical protein